MKKLVVFLSCLVLLLATATGCTKKETNSFIDLKKKQSLFVGADNSFVNSEITTTTESSLTYTLSVAYTLRRATYFVENSVSYQSYYYYWEVGEVTDNQILGNKTVTTSTTYSYLPYGEDENIMVKAKTEVKTEYSYKGGWVEKSFAYQTNLNGYFSSFSTLENFCPELADNIDTSGTKKYYIDVTTPTATYINVEDFKATYYYLLDN